MTMLMVFRSIAWSKWGSIASISPDGKDLYLQTLRCDPKDGSWGLSEPSPIPRVVDDADIELKHVAWSPAGSELAAIDSAGRVSILSIFSSNNKPIMARHARSDPIDDLQRIVGCYWLNVAPFPANRSVCLSRVSKLIH